MQLNGLCLQAATETEAELAKLLHSGIDQLDVEYVLCSDCLFLLLRVCLSDARCLS